MKQLSLWLFKRYWRLEIFHTEWEPLIRDFYGKDYGEGFEAGINHALETLRLKEPK